MRVQRKYWLIPANQKIYAHPCAFEKYEDKIDWRCYENTAISEGDLVYIYFCQPKQRIIYECIVTKTHIKPGEADDCDKLWIDKDEMRKARGMWHFRMKITHRLSEDDFSLSLQKLRDKKGQPRWTPRRLQQITGDKTLVSYIVQAMRDIADKQIQNEAR